MWTIKNKGFSLPEVTVALGLVAGVSLVTMKMVENQKDSEQRIKFHGEVMKATAKIKSSMSDPENCRYMLSGKRIGPFGAPEPVLDGKLETKFKEHATGVVSRVELVRTNTKYYGFKTGNISLRYPESGMTNVAELVIDFRMETKSIFDDQNDANDLKTLRQVIPVVVKQSGNMISECGPAVSETNDAAREKFCKSLGAMAKWESNECKFEDIKCGFGQVPEFQTSSGAITCVDIARQLDPNRLFNEASCTIGAAKNVSIRSVNGKLQVQCN